MNKLIFTKFNCLSKKTISFNELCLKLHKKNKSIDKRYPSEYIQKFIRYNNKVFAFLGINAFEENLNLVLQSNEFVGAVPIKSPIDGKYIGDLILCPRFNGDKDSFEQISELLPILEKSISPEFMDDALLSSGGSVKPPRYYDALVYLKLFDSAQKINWKKFQNAEMIKNQPGASTRWDKYAISSIDPKKKLDFLNKINFLSENHIEWNQLLFVFDIAVNDIISPQTPSKIKFKTKGIIQKISILNSGKSRKKVKEILIRSADPFPIKRLKEQANIILKNKFSEAKAWRINFSELFERYCQYIFENIAKEIGAKSYSNTHFRGTFRNSKPGWSLSRLEPDIILSTKKSIISIDSKYKAHMYNIRSSSSQLKETHRTDLHQLLCYSSFEKNINKVGFLVYPCDRPVLIPLEYRSPISNVISKVFMVGFPIGVTYLKAIKEEIKPYLV